jgi:hypothetical protein
VATTLPAAARPSRRCASLCALGFRFTPHRPREDGLAHPADTARSNLAAALALLTSLAANPDPCPPPFAQLWRTLADDGSLCTCHADFRIFPAVQVLLRQYQDVCVGGNFFGDPQLETCDQYTESTARCAGYPATVTSLDGDGLYRVQFTAPALLMTYALQLVVNNITVRPALTVSVREGLVAAAQTTFRTVGPFAPGTAEVLIAARDRFGQPAVGGEETLLVLVDGLPYSAVAQCEHVGCGAYVAALPLYTGASHGTLRISLVETKRKRTQGKHCLHTCGLRCSSSPVLPPFTPPESTLTGLHTLNSGRIQLHGVRGG